MEQFEARFKQVDVFPMVKHYMDELDLFNIFRKYVPAASGSFSDHAESLCILRRVEQTGGWTSMPQPFVMFVPPYSCPGTIDRMFFEDRRLALVRGFAVAGVHHDVSSAFAVSSQNAC